jgi:hypothetical protein
MKGISLVAVVIGVLVLSAVGTFFGLIIALRSYSEMVLNDEVALGIYGINLYHLIKRTIEEKTKLIIDTTALYLGEKCGGINCGEECRWSIDCPEIEELYKKYQEEMKNNLDLNLPENIRNYNITQPKIKEIKVEEGNITIILEDFSISYNSSYFRLNLTNKTLTVRKNSTYPTFLKIGMDFVENVANEFDKGMKISTKASATREGYCATQEELLFLTEYKNIERIVKNVLWKINEKYKEKSCKAEDKEIEKSYEVRYYNCIPLDETTYYAEAEFIFNVKTRIEFICEDEKTKIPLEGSSELKNLVLKFFVVVNSIIENMKTNSIVVSP